MEGFRTMGWFDLFKASPPMQAPTSTRQVIYRQEYLSNEEQAKLLTLDGAGLPTGRLAHERDRLIIVANEGGMVNPKSPITARLGLYSFTMRGTKHYRGAVKSGQFTPGTQVRLVREPDNKFDPNAVAIHAWNAPRKAGYVNKLNAKRIAKRLDDGEDLVAISTRGAGAGRDSFVPHILVAERGVMRHLLRDLAITLH